MFSQGLQNKSSQDTQQNLNQHCFPTEFVIFILTSPSANCDYLIDIWRVKIMKLIILQITP